MKYPRCSPLRDDEAAGLGQDGHWGPPAVMRELHRLADRCSGRLGMSRRDFLRSQMGLAASFLAFNSVFGRVFAVDAAEAADPDAAARRIASLADQFVFDVQVHYVHDDYPSPSGLLSLRRAAENWNPDAPEEEHGLDDIQFENFYREVFVQSHTKVAVLSNAPNDRQEGWFLSNEAALATRDRVNQRTGRRSLLAHGLITPGQPGWREEFERMLELGPDAIKAYTLGDPGGGSQYPWRLDDQDLVYPVYERLAEAGVRTVCIHKGLLPTGYADWMPPEKVAHAKVGDVGPAARDWPDLDFVIYHAAIEKVIPTQDDVERYRRTGRIDWVTDLAEIPAEFGVDNVYADLGAVFAATVAAHPDLCAGVLGTLIQGLGDDHVCWGTDAVWFGSPQWQIEALRRFEIPERLREEHGYAALGAADGPVKRRILGENSARLYGLDPADYRTATPAKQRR